MRKTLLAVALIIVALMVGLPAYAVHKLGWWGIYNWMFSRPILGGAVALFGLFAIGAALICIRALFYRFVAFLAGPGGRR